MKKPYKTQYRIREIVADLKALSCNHYFEEEGVYKLLSSAASCISSLSKENTRLKSIKKKGEK